MPLSGTPSSARKARASSGSRSTRSLSICALITTASHDRCVSTYSRTLTTYGFVSAEAISSSRTLQAKIVGLSVSRKKGCETARSSSVRATVKAGRPASSAASIFARTPSSPMAVLSPRLTSRAMRSRRFRTESRSASISSVLMISMSRTGSTLPATWWMSSCSKQRTTCTTASTSRMCVRNLLPRPSPWLAPLTRPAMSTNSIAAGMTTPVLAMRWSSYSRASGTVTMPTLGSMVQKG